MTDDTTVAITALRDGDPEQPLYWYEQVKKDLDFDPEAPAQIPDIPALRGGFWSDLDEKYPMPLGERVKQMQHSLGWTQEQIDQERAWISWLFSQERSGEDADEPAQQAAPPDEHPQPEANVQADRDEPQHSGQVGAAGKARSRKGRKVKPVRS